MGACDMDTITPDSVRDAYGFEIKKDFVNLYEPYIPILLREERERTDRWSTFLSSFGEGSADGRSLTVLADQLEPVLSGDEASLPYETLQQRKQLQAFVQAGVPTEIRGKLWKLFLKVADKYKEGLYQRLVKSGMESGTRCRCKTPDATPIITRSRQPSATGPHASDLFDKLLNDPFSSVSSADLLNHLRALEGSSGPAAPPADLRDSFDSGGSDDVPHSPLSPLEGGAEPRGAAKGEDGSDVRHCSLCSFRSAVTCNGTRLDLLDWTTQIEKDLHRTFPNHLLMDANGKMKLKRVLVAYSRYNPYVGYCQGMNFIAGVLLLFMDEEDAFWCLASIVEDLLPGYFSLSMVAPQVDQEVFKELVKQHLLSQDRVFQEHGVEVTSISTQWFLCVYVNALPLESCLRVWDIMFFEGNPTVLFRVGLAMLDIYQKAICATVDAMDCLHLLAQVANVNFDASRLIDVACIGFSHVGWEQIRALKEQKKIEVFMRIKEWPFNHEAVGSMGDELLIFNQFPDQAVTIACRQLFGCDTPPPDWRFSRHNTEEDELDSAHWAAHKVGALAMDIREAAEIAYSNGGEAEERERVARSQQPMPSGRALAPVKLRHDMRAKLDKLQRFPESPHAHFAEPAGLWEGGDASTPRGGHQGRPMQFGRMGRQGDKLVSMPYGPGQTGGWSGAAVRAPSRARIAAYEIAANPAIRHVAIAQSFLRAERMANQALLRTNSEPESAKAHPPPPSGEQLLDTSSGSPGGGAPFRTLSAQSAPGLLRAQPSYLASTTLLNRDLVPNTGSMAMLGDSPGSGGRRDGGGGRGGNHPGNGILHQVLDGLRKEVAVAQQRRVEAERKSSELQQTSSQLTSKLNNLLQTLEEKKRTVEDLEEKVTVINKECEELEEEVFAKEEKIKAAQLDQAEKAAELREKEELIANLQAKVKRFQRRSK